MKETDYQKYSELFENSFEAILLLNSEGILVYSNKEANNLFENILSGRDLVNFTDLFDFGISFQSILNESQKKNKFFYENEVLKLKVTLLDKDELLLVNLQKKNNNLDLIEEAADSFIVLDKQLNITFVNKSACKLTGYLKEVLLAKTYQSLFSEKELQLNPINIKSVENGETVIVEREVIRKDNSKVQAEIRTKKLSDGNYLSILRDISSRIKIRKQLESKNQELKETYDKVIRSENKYRQLFKNIPLGIFTANEKGKIESINAHMLEILGSSSAEVSMQFNLFELPTLKGTELLADLKECFIKGKSFLKNYEYTSVWDKKSYLKSHILPFDREGEKRILVIVEDYSKLRESEVRLRILSEGVNNSPASIVVTDELGKIIFVNKSFIQLTGYSLNELIGETPAIINSGYHSKDFYTNLWNTIRSGQEWVGEFRNQKKNGEIFWESAMISALKDEKGKITNFMAIKEDITNKKAVEKELKFRSI